MYAALAIWTCLSGFAHSEIGSPKSSRLLDLQPTPATRALIDGLLHASTSLTILYTPQRAMGRVGYSRDLAERRAKFELTIHCGSTCDLESFAIGRRLSTGRRIAGNCPRPIALVIYFSSKERPRFDSLHATSNGQCFSIRGHAYFLTPENSLIDLVAPLVDVLSGSAQSQDR